MKNAAVGERLSFKMALLRSKLLTTDKKLEGFCGTEVMLVKHKKDF